MTGPMIMVATVMAAVPDPAAGLLRLARRTAAQELAALGAGRRPGAFVISLVQIIGESGLEFDSGVEIFSCALTAAGLYFSFTGDAQGLVQRVNRVSPAMQHARIQPPRAAGMTLRNAAASAVSCRLCSMEWTDEGIVLGVRRHGESSAIVELLTRGHGRHLGLVRGGAGSRMRPLLQPGNRVRAVWRARLDEHLGYYALEGIAVARRHAAGLVARGLWRDPSGLAGAAAAGARSA